MENFKKSKIIILLGPTASGKTELGIKLAQRFNGEVVSADSRQVYTKMNIGTAKPFGEWQLVGGSKVYVVKGIPHYLMDIIDPKEQMSVAQFKELAVGCLYAIQARGKLPIVVGGTGQYLWALIDNLIIPAVAPSQALRASLEQKSLAELQQLLQHCDPESYQAIDRHNPRRVLRALEVAMITGKSFIEQRRVGAPLFNTLQIGIHWPWEKLLARINRRVEEQIAQGLDEETKRLVQEQYGWDLPSMSSIGYQQMGSYVRGECTKAEAVRAIQVATRQYAKRQITWFKRDKRINWIEGDDIVTAVGLIEKFLQEK